MVCDEEEDVDDVEEAERERVRVKDLGVNW